MTDSESSSDEQAATSGATPATSATDNDPNVGAPADNIPRRAVNYEHSREFVPILKHIHSSLLVSTYAAGKLAMVGTGDRNGTGEIGLDMSFTNFQQAMGVAVSQSKLAIGGQNIIWFLENGGGLVKQIEPKGHYGACYLSREAFITGNIHCHEMAWGKDGQLWICNTLFSCLCTLHDDFNFVPRWRPSFISGFAAEDRCHMNGIAIENGEPKYVTAMGEVDTPHGWRENKAGGGIVIDIQSNEIIARGLCMPHSPRIHQGKLFALDSGNGRLVTIDRSNGKIDTVAEIPAYVRGLAFQGQFAFVGMSRAREQSIFGGVPICADDKRDELRCGVVAVDLLSGQPVAFLQFQSGIEEIFDVQVVPGSNSTCISGPFPAEDESTPIWVVPEPSLTDELIRGSKPGPVSRNR